MGWRGNIFQMSFFFIVFSPIFEGCPTSEALKEASAKPVVQQAMLLASQCK